MITIAWYLLKVTVCSGILFGYYWLALRNKVFHQYNRFYLLCTIMLSILLPFVQINFWQNTAEQTSAIKVIEAVSYGNTYVNNFVLNATPPETTFNWQTLYPIAYLLISILLSIGFIKMLFQICTLLKKYPSQKIDEVTFVNTDNEKGTPFSFLQYIFWNSQIDTSTAQGNQIFKHELAHIKEKHTYDKLLINLILIAFWFNPFFWLLRKELNLIHEFIADKKAVEDGDTSAFAAMLLQTIYPQHQFAIANNFFYSPIKRRLVMLTKIKNPTTNYIGRILVLPLAVLVLAAFTFKVNKHTTHLYNGKKVTVVIDAGHGGDKDPGASNGAGVYEKNLTLEFAKFIKANNTNPNINIALIRENDTYVSPMQKAEMANAKNPDLFISLHVDGAPRPSSRNGMSFWVARNQFPNTEKSKIFASALQNEFISNYGITVIPEIMQREVGIWVLQNVNAPSVLIETGYITNENDVKYLQTQAAKETIAKNILMGIEKYLTQKNVPAILADTVPQSSPASIQLTKNAENDLVDENKKANNPEFVLTTKLPTTTALANKLYIVNGIETSKEDVEKINTERIEDVRILSGKIAFATYGDKGKNGVIIINVKQVSDGTYAAKMIAKDDDLKKLGKNPYIIINGEGYEGNTLQKIMLTTGVDHFNSITILNPNEAVKKFGSKGADGAVIATTEKASEEIQTSKNLPNIAIALDKMNVLYIGVDNPITIAVSGYKVEDLIVSMTNGSIEGKNGKYIARVTNPNPAEIIIETIENGVRKLIGTQTYRVKRVPDPIDKIAYSNFAFDIKPKIGIEGVSKNRLKAADFLKATKITAGTGFEVVQATVYFSGAGFPKVKLITLNGNNLSQLKEFLDNCVAGTSITFDSIKVKGDNNFISYEDGVTFTLY